AKSSRHTPAGRRGRRAAGHHRVVPAHGPGLEQGRVRIQEHRRRGQGVRRRRADREQGRHADRTRHRRERRGGADGRGHHAGRRQAPAAAGGEEPERAGRQVRRQRSGGAELLDARQDGPDVGRVRRGHHQRRQGAVRQEGSQGHPRRLRRL
ncbi:MAG: Sulfur oxidation protein SoxY, partial [uncultured Ramlibacter sp.]